MGASTDYDNVNSERRIKSQKLGKIYESSNPKKCKINSIPMRNEWKKFSKSNKKAPDYQRLKFCSGGPDGTRTRDPMRDRHVF